MNNKELTETLLKFADSQEKSLLLQTELNKKAQENIKLLTEAFIVLDNQFKEMYQEIEELKKRVK